MPVAVIPKLGSRPLLCDRRTRRPDGEWMDVARTGRARVPGPVVTTGKPAVVWLSVALAILLVVLSFFNWIQIGADGVAPWDIFGAVSALGWADGLWALVPMLVTVLLVITVGVVLMSRTLTEQSLSARFRAWSAGLVVLGYVFSLIYVLQTTSAVTPESLLRSCNDAGFDGSYCVTQVQDTMTGTPELFNQDAGVALWLSTILGVVFAVLLVSQPRPATQPKQTGKPGRPTKPRR